MGLPVPPFATPKVPAKVIAPVVPVLGVNPVVPALNDVTPAAGSAWNVGATPAPFEVSTCVAVPTAVDVGTAPAPPPSTTPYCVNAAEEVIVPVAV